MTLIGKRSCVLGFFILVLGLSHCSKPTQAARKCQPPCAEAGPVNHDSCCGDPLRIFRQDGGDIQFGAHEPTQCLVPPAYADGSVYETLADGGEVFCPERYQ